MFCAAKQMTGFYIKHNTGLKWVDMNQEFKFLSYSELNEEKRKFSRITILECPSERKIAKK